MHVVGCFLMYNNQFLVLLRQSKKPNGNTWGLPAGKVEGNEPAAEAIQREVLEETGYKIPPNTLIHVSDHTFGALENKYFFSSFVVHLKQKIDIKLEDSAHAESRWVTAEECLKIENVVPDLKELIITLRIGEVRKYDNNK